MISMRNQMSAPTPPGSQRNIPAMRSSPCSPRKASENTCAQMRMNIIIAVILVVDWHVSRSTFHDMRPATAVTKIAPSAPIDAASVGAAIPAMIDPRTASTSVTGGSTTFTKRSHKSRRASASRSSFGIGGTESGRIIPRITMYTQ